MAYNRYNNKSNSKTVSSKTVSSGSSLSKTISENKTLAAAFLLIFLVLFFLLVLRRDSRSGPEDRRIEVHGLSKRSAFNLTASKHTYSAGSYKGRGSSNFGGGSSYSSKYSGGTPSSVSEVAKSFKSTAAYREISAIDTRGGKLGVAPNFDAIDEQLDAIEKEMDKHPRTYTYPPGADKNVRDELDAERSEEYLKAVSAFNSLDYDKAESMFKDLINNAGGNKFKELFAWGSLMEIYKRRGQMDRFRQAFGEFARKGQELRDFYGPLSDSIAAGYATFKQIEKIDPGKLREGLAAYNMKNKSNVSYNDMMRCYKKLSDMYPTNLEMSEDYKKVFGRNR